MRIAVTYDNDGTILQHFGKTQTFKVYEVEDGKVLYSEYVDADGQGHIALTETLKENAISVLICGSVGMGAQLALDEAEITLVTGQSGNADEAVEKYLKDEITSAGVTCTHEHHHHHDHDHECSCGCHHDHDHEHDDDHDDDDDDHECGCHHDHDDDDHHCCCHDKKPAFEGKNVGKTCKTHYEGTFDDGTVFDSSYLRGEPIEFVCGGGMMILGYDKAVADMEVGQIVNVHLTADEAYGPKNEALIYTFQISDLPGCESLSVGDQVALAGGMGQPIPVTVLAKDAETITLDANHEMAGKELNFKIELVAVED